MALSGAAASRAVGAASRARPAVEALCRCLALLGLGQLSPENLRRAKLGRALPEDGRLLWDAADRVVRAALVPPSKRDFPLRDDPLAFPAESRPGPARFHTLWWLRRWRCPLAGRLAGAAALAPDGEVSASEARVLLVVIGWLSAQPRTDVFRWAAAHCLATCPVLGVVGRAREEQAPGAVRRGDAEVDRRDSPFRQLCDAAVALHSRLVSTASRLSAAHESRSRRDVDLELAAWEAGTPVRAADAVRAAGVVDARVAEEGARVADWLAEAQRCLHLWSHRDVWFQWLQSAARDECGDSVPQPASDRWRQQPSDAETALAPASVAVLRGRGVASPEILRDPTVVAAGAATEESVRGLLEGARGRRSHVREKRRASLAEWLGGRADVLAQFDVFRFGGSETTE